MNKFLHRHKKKIMFFGTLVLLITFLAPAGIDQVVQSFGARNAVVAYVHEDSEIRAKEWSEYQEEIRVLETLQGTGSISLNFFENNKPNLAHWFLLNRQAHDLNYTMPSPVPPDLNAQNAARLNVDPRILDRAFGKFMGVARMTNGFASALHISDQRLKAFAQRQYLVARGDVLVVPAVARDDAPFPPEQAINDHFAKYSAVKPGEGDNGFGYMLPDRAKLEWLTFSPEAIREAIRSSPQFSSTEQRKHWEKYATERRFPAPPDDGAYAPVPEDVKDDLLQTLVDVRLAEITKFVADRLRLDRRGLKETAGIVQLPENWLSKRLSFADLAQQVQQQFGFLPAYNSTGGEWKSVEQIGELPGIGVATTMKFGRTAMDLASLVAAAHEFNAQSPVPIQQGIEGPVLNDRQGNQYIFRILDADPARAPRDVTEVRLEVIADLRKIMDYESLLTQVPSLQIRAQEEGLLTLGLQRGEPVTAADIHLSNPALILQNASAFRQFLGLELTADLPDPIRNHKPTVEAVIDRIMEIPNVVQDVDVSTLPAEDRTFIFPVKDKLALLIVRLNNVTPLTAEQYTQLVDMGEVQTSYRRHVLQSQDALRDTFSLAALTKRYNFRLAQAESGDSGSTTDSASSATPTRSDRKSNADATEAPKL